MTAKRKLIEVSLPLDAINIACKADKDRKTGTIRNLHKWFAPMPLPAWRSLLFAALVDDPGDERERERLLRLTERLVENGADLPDPDVVAAARREIEASWPQGVPVVLDPFCGGGSTLVEAQRLGCATRGSDLNPVPVLVSKVLTELLPKTMSQPALHDGQGSLPMGPGPQAAIAVDVLHYAKLIEGRVRKEIGHLFSPQTGVGEPLLWLWCRSVQCPNPACGIDTPLTTSWVVSKAPGAERWLVPRVQDGSVSFDLGGPAGTPPPVPKLGRGATFRCVACQATVDENYLMETGRARGLGLRLLGVVEISDAGRNFRCTSQEEETTLLDIGLPEDAPDVALPQNSQYSSPPLFGLTTHAALYPPRQLQAMSALAREIRVVAELVNQDGGDTDRAQTIAAILGLALGKLAQYTSSQALIRLRGSGTKAESGFTRADIPMTWDFCEINPFCSVGASWLQMVATALRALPYVTEGDGLVEQHDARSASDLARDECVLVATDPPYFGQIPYADLSDYFYVWLRLALRPVFPQLFTTRAAPKTGELVGIAANQGGPEAARRYFIEGFTESFHGLSSVQANDAPMLVVYAFKEQNGRADGTGIAPGWEAILEAIISAGLMVVGTWPIHGTGSTRMRSMGSNAVATYVVLACRTRPDNAQRVTRSTLVQLLRAELVQSVADLQKANIAPVDLAQAVIGPGMEVYSRHGAVLEPDGSRVSVASALALINRTLAEILDEQEGDLDPDSRWAVTWYEQHGFGESTFGEADQLARAKGIAVDSLVRAGVVLSRSNKVGLIPRADLPTAWDPATDRCATAWEAVQHLVRTLDLGGEMAAAALYKRLGVLADPTRELAYRLFVIAETHGRTDEAVGYNALVASWSEIARLAESLPADTQHTFDVEALF